MLRPMLRGLIATLLGASDDDTVTRRIRQTIARSRARRRVNRLERMFPHLGTFLRGRQHTDAIIRNIGSHRR